MKTKSLFVLPALVAALNLLSVSQAPAQTFRTLHTFTGNNDGDGPFAGLTLSGNTLYGTAIGGGTSGLGTVFGISTDGTGFIVLHNFAGYPSDGERPRGELILSGNTLYGTTGGGLSLTNNGTVFALNTGGTGFTNLHRFTPILSQGTNADGGRTGARLILSGATLYGTAPNGGSAGSGTVFAVSTNGTGFTNLHNFQQDFASFPSDGALPRAGLILSGNALYGATADGGTWNVGTVFALNTNGTSITILHSFAALTGSDPSFNSDGSGPEGGLILSGNTLYGTARYDGLLSAGTVFAVNADGTGFTNLHNFAGYPFEGDGPMAGLILSGNTLYGTTSQGGSSNAGTVFALSTNGTGFTNLYSFTGGSDGADPFGGRLILSGNTLYGTTAGGGSAGNHGIVFSLSFRPQLTITPSGTNVILSWPTNVAGFDYTGYRLQSTTNPVSSAVWSTNSPAPVVIAGQNTVTNPITGARQFYRLVQ
jgi:uncharacterized repeat protein (TIGR03803 family)